MSQIKVKVKVDCYLKLNRRFGAYECQILRQYLQPTKGHTIFYYFRTLPNTTSQIAEEKNLKSCIINAFDFFYTIL